MTTAIENNGPTDEQLVSYLDGELPVPERNAISQRLAVDPDLLERLNLLKKGGRPFRDAFAPLLEQAPEAALQAALKAQLKTVRKSWTQNIDKEVPSGRRLPLGWAAFAATLVIAFCAGLLTGTRTDLAPVRETGPVLSHAEAWRQAVADYQALYTYPTLANQPDSAEAHERDLARVSRAIGVELPLDAVSVAPLKFKRAQILQFQGRPLVQLAYLNGRKPFAFCIVRSNAADKAPKLEVRKGLTIVHWARDDRSYMVIGVVSEEEANRIAKELRARLG
ncbi:MAG: anti-sigma factor family protein [Methyloligellaceae bacterium]